MTREEYIDYKRMLPKLKEITEKLFKERKSTKLKILNNNTKELQK